MPSKICIAQAQQNDNGQNKTSEQPNAPRSQSQTPNARQSTTGQGGQSQSPNAQQSAGHGEQNSPRRMLSGKTATGTTARQRHPVEAMSLAPIARIRASRRTDNRRCFVLPTVMLPFGRAFFCPIAPSATRSLRRSRSVAASLVSASSQNATNVRVRRRSPCLLCSESEAIAA